MSFLKLIEQLEVVASQVNDYIYSLLEGKPKVLYDASSHLIRTGGKRLRPFLVIKSFELFDKNLKKAIPAAAAIELIHNFTLVHDDIIDHDLLRHNAPTVHAKYGVPLAIVAGDILFAKAFESVVLGMQKMNIEESVIVKVLELVAKSSIKVSEGQIKDLRMASGKRFYSKETYFDMIQSKTAALFETACRIGSIIGGAGKEDEKSMANFGKYLGIAFQLVDDVLGIAGDPKVTGKPIGSDLREGKKTHALSLALKLANDEDRIKIQKVFGKRKTTKDEMDEALAVIAKTEVVDKIRDEAQFYANKALSILKRYPDSHAKKSLSELANFIVARNF
ncbi:MAG: polyprenyl synthetase family protein [Nitrososphaerales archaeon]